jgi:hypothetical protein
MTQVNQNKYTKKANHLLVREDDFTCIADAKAFLDITDDVDTISIITEVLNMWSNIDSVLSTLVQNYDDLKAHPNNPMVKKALRYAVQDVCEAFKVEAENV